MATESERQEARTEVNDLLGRLNEVNATTLGRKEELSPDINFEGVVTDFQRMLDIVQQVHDRDLFRIPIQELNGLKGALTKLEALIEKVRTFSLQQGNPASIQSSISAEITNSYDDVVRPMMLTLAFTATQATDYARIEREAQGFHTRLKDEAAAFEKNLNEKQKAADEALGAIKSQAAQAGVSAHSKLYAQQADSHSKAAVAWFWATVVATGLTLLVAASGLAAVFYYTPAGTAEAIQYITAKIIVLSVLSFSILWSSRNYRAQKHNETLNRHRANSLGTFRTFLEGTQEQATRDGILMFCAHSAFGHRPSGYDGPSRPDAPPQIVNPVLDLIGKQGSSVE